MNFKNSCEHFFKTFVNVLLRFEHLKKKSNFRFFLTMKKIITKTRKEKGNFVNTGRENNKKGRTTTKQT